MQLNVIYKGLDARADSEREFIARVLAKELERPLEEMRCLLKQIGSPLYTNLEQPIAEKLVDKFRMFGIEVELVKADIAVDQTLAESNEVQISTNIKPTQPTKQCPLCAETILLEAKKCKHCGEILDQSIAKSRVIPSPIVPVEKVSEAKATKDNPVLTGVGLGFLSLGPSILIAGVMFLLGGLLSATGIGAIIGIPIMLAAILVPVFSLGLAGAVGYGIAHGITGNCPHCGKQVRALKSASGLTCNACNKRSVIRDNKFIGID